jgi:hypothetical protein
MAAGNNNQIEKRLWGAADKLRANSKLKSSEYSIPVWGLSSCVMQTRSSPPPRRNWKASERTAGRSASPIIRPKGCFTCPKNGKKDLPVMQFICKRCGNCCLNLTDAFQCSVDQSDIDMWRENFRDDILEWVDPIDCGNGERVYDIWISPVWATTERGPKATRMVTFLTGLRMQ